MKRAYIFGFSLLLLIGCVRSVHPFYTDAQVIYDPAIIGSWADAGKENKFVVTGDPENKQYKVLYTDNKAKTGRFVAHLAKVQGTIIADLFPEEPRMPDSPAYVAHLMPLHSFLLLEYNAASIRVRLMDPEWLKKQIDADPAAIKHEKVEDEIVLTASPEQLQAFIIKNLKTQGAFGDTTDFLWQAPATQPAP